MVKLILKSGAVLYVNPSAVSTLCDGFTANTVTMRTTDGQQLPVRGTMEEVITLLRDNA